MVTPKQNPFSLYDFLGYAVPGALALYGLLALGSAASGGAFHDDVVAHLDFKNAELYIPFLLLSYLTGHLASFVSSITVERYSVWQFGYPSKYLLRREAPGFFAQGSPSLPEIVLRLLVWLLLIPIALLDLLLGAGLRLRPVYVRALDPTLAALLTKKVEALARQAGNIDTASLAGDADFFRFVYHYAVEHAPNHFPKMQNYVALYGFLRTTCLLAVLFFWAVLYLGLCGTIVGSLLLWLVLVLLLVSFVLFLAFVKFYRRFSLEALMALSVVIDS